MNKPSLDALHQAVKVVGLTRLAEAIGVRPPTIHVWFKYGRAPAERVLAIEKATGVSRHELRPDIYPIETGHQQAA